VDDNAMHGRALGIGACRSLSISLTDDVGWRGPRRISDRSWNTVAGEHDAASKLPAAHNSPSCRETYAILG
jgi:hypothetical protein